MPSISGTPPSIGSGWQMRHGAAEHVSALVMSTGDTGSDKEPAREAGTITQQKCLACKRTRPITDFPLKKKGAGAHQDRNRTCEECATRKQAWRAKEKSEEAPGGKKPLGANKKKARTDALDRISLTTFLRFLEEKGKICNLEACVSASEIEGDRRKRADALAEMMWKRLELRFM